MPTACRDVVLVPFPYRDRLDEKIRPALVISSDSYNANGDVIIAQITTHVPRLMGDVALTEWQAASLKSASTVRMLLATVAESRIVFHIGRVTDSDWRQVQQSLRSIFA